jgi:hypothetical protein
MYKKIAQIELTEQRICINLCTKNFSNFIGDVRFVSCLSLASINVTKQVNIDRLVSSLRRRRGIFLLNSEILFAQVVLSARESRRFCQNGASESCQLRLDLVLSKIPYQ